MNALVHKYKRLTEVALILLIFCIGTMESRAQIHSSNINAIQILSPIFQMITEEVNADNPNSEDFIEPSEISYLDSGIFLLEENLKVCKDLLIQLNDSTICTKDKDFSKVEIQQIKNNKTENPIQSKVKKKKKRKSIWNFPGNKKSSI